MNNNSDMGQMDSNFGLSDFWKKRKTTIHFCNDSCDLEQFSFASQGLRSGEERSGL